MRRTDIFLIIVTCSIIVLLAGYCLGRSENDEVFTDSSQSDEVSELIKRFRNKELDWIDRENAAIRLGEIGDARAFEPLVDALNEDDSSIKSIAIAALGNLGDKRAIQPLLNVLEYSFLESDDAADALAKLGAVDQLLTVLEGGRSNSRAEAAKVLGEQKEARAVELLIAALDDEDVLLRQAAAEALGNIGDLRAEEHIVPLLNDIYVDDHAAQALVKLGADKSLQTAFVSGSVTARIAAAKALGQWKENPSVRYAKMALVLALIDEPADVRKAAIEALGELGDPGMTEHILPSLDDTKPEIRRAAIEAIGKLGDSGLVEYLLPALSDEDPEIRRITIKILGKTGDAGVAKHLLPLLSDEDPEVRKYTAYLLSEEFSSTASGEALNKAALEVKDLAVVAGAYRYFIRQGSNGSEALLIQAFEKYGTASMAEGFLNCGNERLEKIAGEWISREGYTIMPNISLQQGTTWGGK